MGGGDVSRVMGTHTEPGSSSQDGHPTSVLFKSNFDLKPKQTHRFPWQEKKVRRVVRGCGKKSIGAKSSRAVKEVKSKRCPAAFQVGKVFGA